MSFLHVDFYSLKIPRKYVMYVHVLNKNDKIHFCIMMHAKIHDTCDIPQLPLLLSLMFLNRIPGDPH